MRKIIHDCDCTFGINGCDVDDGLALLYLLGDPEVQVLGVTTTYGNSVIEDVYPNTVRFLKQIGRADIPVYEGGACPGELDSEASRYLAEMAEKHAGETNRINGWNYRTINLCKKTDGRAEFLL